MPKRSNAYQKLIHLIHEQLAQGATVTESKALADGDAGVEREVDIVTEGNLAGAAIMVSVECRAHKRPSDVSWVDEMCGKHERLPTTHLVLLSESGFTPSARDKAAGRGAEALSLDWISQLSD